MTDTLDRIPSNPIADAIDSAFPLPAPVGKETMEQLRKRMNLSRREVATLAGVTQSQVWRMEHADLATSEVMWIKIWDALVAFEGENPDGKPKITPKTKAPKADNTTHKNDLEEISTRVSYAIDVAKQKKQSSVQLQTIFERIEEMLIELSK